VLFGRDSEPTTALFPASLEDLFPAAGLHPLAKPVGLFSLPFLRLIRSFHGLSAFSDEKTVKPDYSRAFQIKSTKQSSLFKGGQDVHGRQKENGLKFLKKALPG